MFKKKKLPTYKIISKKGPEHDPEFTISVAFDRELFAIGKGKNKQDAEINAASILLKKLKNIKKMRGRPFFRASKCGKIDIIKHNNKKENIYC